MTRLRLDIVCNNVNGLMQRSLIRYHNNLSGGALNRDGIKLKLVVIHINASFRKMI